VQVPIEIIIGNMRVVTRREKSNEEEGKRSFATMWFAKILKTSYYLRGNIFKL
jgi:hypothetical protein